ncbi:hypothetical protein SAMN05444144_104101 [Flavobacterium akiainvivens]|nr:hypothetical protein SAMN05444144_104101 [Flavobacterium akiainvivens]
MTFLEKYPQLKNKAMLKQMIARSTYATMALEGQEVSKEKIDAIVERLIETE